MGLEVGVNSYITVEEANSLIADNFPSIDEARMMWNSLTDKDKESMLIRSCRGIEDLDFNSNPLTTKQNLHFPCQSRNRVPGVTYVLYVSQFYDNSLNDGHRGNSGKSLEKAKLAQAINAAYGALLNKENTSQIRRSVSGLTSKKAGPIAESYGNTNVNTFSRDMMSGIYTKQVYTILKPWLSRSRGGI